jgi:hypothetical protein
VLFTRRFASWLIGWRQPGSMTMRQFHDWQKAGAGGDVSLHVGKPKHREVPWRITGGLAVNHRARESMATAYEDVVIAAGRVEEAVKALREVGFPVRKSAWSVNLKARSRVSVQISAEDTYHDFPGRSIRADIRRILMCVAGCEDTFRGKLLAYPAAQRRASKRQKDLLDIMRLLEAHPKLRNNCCCVAKKIAED